MYINVENVLLIFLILQVASAVLMIGTLNKILQETRNTSRALRGEEVADEHHFTDDDLFSYDASEAVEMMTEEERAYFEEKERKEREFDERIKQMKEELSGSIPEKPRVTGIVADVLADGVENLPHDTIQDFKTKPPVIEYTD